MRAHGYLLLRIIQGVAVFTLLVEGGGGRRGRERGRKGMGGREEGEGM